MTDAYGFVIVGGGPAGLAAARAYRDAGGSDAVAIVADEGRMPYDRPPLTKELLRGELDESELPLEEESWLAEQRIAFIAGRAVALEDGGRRLTLSGGRRLSYETCLLATGAEPTRLGIDGADDPAVHVVRSLDHVRDLRARLGADGGAVVIGSGFIGCEIAASLALSGHRVSLVSDEPAPNLNRLGGEAAETIAGWLRELGVELLLGTAVEAIHRTGRELQVIAGDHRPTAPVVVMATGVAPRSELIAGADGLSPADPIPVDAAMRTSMSGVLAAGDVCLARNTTAGRRLRVEHWGDALGQGEVAGRTAAGAVAAWDAVPGFWSSIGRHTLKYVAWGDGFDSSTVERDGSALTVWYRRGGRLVGVLTHDADANYEQARAAIARDAR